MTELIKAVVPARGRGWLSQGLGWVAGYVVKRTDVSTAATPAVLHAELGLGFPASPLTANAPYVDTLRIPEVSYAALTSPGTGTDTSLRDHSPFSGTGFVESASALVPYWWLAPSALPAGTTLWRMHADGREELLAAYAHVAVGWLSVQADFALQPVPVRSAELVGLWADAAGERLLADVLPDGTIILCAPQRRDSMRQSARGVWWREATSTEVERIYAVRVVGSWRSRAVQLVAVQSGETGDDAHIVYIGGDAFEAEALGLTKTDAGVYEGVVPIGELEDLREQQTDIPMLATDGAA